MAKFDKDKMSAGHRAERAATNDVLEKGDKGKFREFCDETARKVPSDTDNDGK